MNTTPAPALTATSSLPKWLEYVENLHISAIDLGLDRTAQVAQSAQLTKPAPTIITVAGTNGKGSTCAILESILLDAGYKVGVYSSPHLIHYNERVRINGQRVTDECLTQAFNQIEDYRGDISLSFFEFGTLAALNIFKQSQLDVVILEVGLGGRLDATNVVDHDVAIITSLAVDHVDWLGDDINVIGYEKAGIFRAGMPAICGQPDSPATVAGHADDIGATLYQVKHHFDYNIDEKDSNIWHWKSGVFELSDLPVPNLPLANAATALMALGVSGLEITDINVVNGLNNAQLAGRMQQLSDSPLILLDVAHNPHSAQYLAKQLTAKYPDLQIHAVIGMLNDKDIAGTLAELKHVIDQWYLSSIEGPRGASAETLANLLNNVSDTNESNKIASQQFSSPETAFKVALDMVTTLSNGGKPTLLLVAGSFYTVGDVLNYWQSIQ